MKDHKTISRHRILIVDDNAAIHDDFRKILNKRSETDALLTDMESVLFGSENVSPAVAYEPFELEYAFQGREGLEMVCRAKEEGRPFSLAFVDGRMPPGWDGIETISHLWKACPELQVVLCTAYSDYSWQEIRDILGENDNLLILKKPFDNMEVLQMAHTLTCKWALGREVDGRLNRLAFYDNLTGLPNRVLFLDRLEYAVQFALRHQYKGALLFIDLDNFKRINDTLGHSVGDELLKIMAARLKECNRITDTVSCFIEEKEAKIAARLGGDEFTVILPRINGADNAAVVARRIVERMARPVVIGQNEFIVTPSIGVAIFPDDGDTVEELLKNADLAMYFAKRNGSGNFKYFQESMNDLALKRLTIENQLRQAIERNELYLHYQPQVDLPSGELIGVEALLRWDNHELGCISPVEFIPIAEESGLIINIGEWVLRTACAQAAEWINEGLPLKRIAVNVSLKQFTHPHFVGTVEHVLRETELPADCLEIEITESLFAQDIGEVSELLGKLQSKSIRIAVDDFGTGYSSLSRLKDMPIDCLKIDRSFVYGLEQNMHDKSIISAIMAMAEGMGLRVLAEGVDSSNQLRFLIDKRCGEAQGFYFSRPLPPDRIEILLRKGLTAGNKAGKALLPEVENEILN